jgi:hypothetical protein
VASPLGVITLLAESLGKPSRIGLEVGGFPSRIQKNLIYQERDRCVIGSNCRNLETVVRIRVAVLEEIKLPGPPGPGSRPDAGVNAAIASNPIRILIFIAI